MGIVVESYTFTAPITIDTVLQFASVREFGLPESVQTKVERMQKLLD